MLCSYSFQELSVHDKKHHCVSTHNLYCNIQTLKCSVHTFREITEYIWKASKMFRLGKKQPPASSVCSTFRDILWFSCVDNSLKYPLANHSWNYQTCIYNTKNSGGNHCNWGLRMAQRKKKSVLENTLLLQSSARIAGIRES